MVDKSSSTMPTMGHDKLDILWLRSFTKLGYMLLCWVSNFSQQPIVDLTVETETMCDNKEIIETNIRNVKISSPDVRPFLGTDIL